ncbi:MAG: twin-arginine translocation signal domain-containing protein [Anaerolineales bacterium]|nr:twin-arginine translocation signal domain-containing protein [Anaerolineales bacterium]
MALSRRDFMKVAATAAGGWALGVAPPILARDYSDEIGDSSNQVLFDLGAFPANPGRNFYFDENKYSPLKRELPPAEWKSTNRHLPIELNPEVINSPGQRSPEALKKVVEFTGFHHPRYVASSGERVTMCNIAAWDWSRALQVHQPHWKGETEMSANMLYRWITHSQAGGVYGEGWQPVGPLAAQLLANRGLPVFALAENPTPGRHGHVAMVYPKMIRSIRDPDRYAPEFATVKSGRGNRGNGIMSLSSTFRHYNPSYFVHIHDFVVHRKNL